LARIPPENVAVSSITDMEVEFGLALNPKRLSRVGAVVKDFMHTIEHLPFDLPAARAAATLRAALHRRGRPVGAYDSLIAGLALARGLVLVTANEREFQRLEGLAVENWRKP
jgi:tRNA(fMet)-specific endonuclease VapC